MQYIGFNYEVMQLLQVLSHTTRAFVYNADALKGFMIKVDFVEILRQAHRKGKLEEIGKHQILDFDALETGISKHRTLKDKL